MPPAPLKSNKSSCPSTHVSVLQITQAHPPATTIYYGKSHDINTQTSHHPPLTVNRQPPRHSHSPGPHNRLAHTFSFIHSIQLVFMWAIFFSSIYLFFCSLLPCHWKDAASSRNQTWIRWMESLGRYIGHCSFKGKWLFMLSAVFKRSLIILLFRCLISFVLFWFYCIFEI